MGVDWWSGVFHLGECVFFWPSHAPSEEVAVVFVYRRFAVTHTRLDCRNMEECMFCWPKKARKREHGKGSMEKDYVDLTVTSSRHGV